MVTTNARLSFQRQTPTASFPINATIPCEWHHRDILLRARFLRPAIYLIESLRSGGTVRYAEFRNRLENALRDVGLFVHDADRVETINLADTVRHWKAYIRRSAPSAEPFSVSAEISFLWTPFDAARSYTCEEDRRRRQPPRTARRWTRVHLSLYANLPYGSTTSMLEPHVFAAWTTSIVEKAHATFSEIEERNGHIVAVLGAHGDLQVEVRCKQTGWHCFFEGCGDLWISDGSRASGLGRSRASRGGEGIRTPNLPDWQGRSRPLSTSRRRVSRHWRPGSGIRPRHPERSQSSPGSRMNPRTMMTAGRRRYTDHAPAE